MVKTVHYRSNVYEYDFNTMYRRSIQHNTEEPLFFTELGLCATYLFMPSYIEDAYRNFIAEKYLLGIEDNN